MHLVDFIIRIYHDARSSACQKWASLLHNSRLRKLLLAHAHEENPCLAFLEDFADLTTRHVHINGLRIAWVNSEFKFPIPGIKGFARISPLRKHYNMILNLGTGCIGRVHCRTCGYCATVISLFRKYFVKPSPVTFVQMWMFIVINDGDGDGDYGGIIWL